jgi:PAS domain S-box-containing protein
MKHAGKTKAQLISELEEVSQRLAGDALKESEKKYRHVVENANEGIIVTQDGKLKYANPRTSHFTGHTVDELTSRPFVDFIHTDDREMVMGHYLSRLKGEKAPETYIFRVINRDGGIKWIEIRSININWEDKPATLSFLRDVTERKRIEEALKNHLQEQTVLNSLARQVSSTLSIDQVVKSALNGIVSTVKPDLALLYSRVGERLILSDLRSDKIDFSRDKAQVHRVGSCLCGLAASEKKSVFSRNLQADPRCTLKECKEAGLQSFVALPLIGQDEVIGVLGLASIRDRDFGQQTTFLESVTSQVSIALQNASLYEKVQQSSLQLEKNINELKKVEEALRKREADLKEQSDHLEQVNAALNVLLSKREEDRSALEESVVVNVKELVLPYLEKLKKSELQSEKMTLITILESHLKDIISPFTTKLSSQFIKLTATEIKIANLVKDGRTNKEMASMLDLSENTVKNHRSQIRNKLGIKHKKINLRSYLRSLSK